MHKVALGVGSNLGDTLRCCQSAVKALVDNGICKVEKLSSWYYTEPQGYREQNWFVNGALIGSTSLDPQEMLFGLKEIERQLGRTQSFRWGPRAIDLDILFYDNLLLESENLTIPHKLLHLRRFVLVPMVEIAPSWFHPVLKKSVKELLKNLSPKGQKVKRIAL